LGSAITPDQIALENEYCTSLYSEESNGIFEVYCPRRDFGENSFFTLPQYLVVFVQKGWSGNEIRWKQSFYIKKINHDRNVTKVIEKNEFFVGTSWTIEE